MATWRGSCLSRAVLLACLALGLFSIVCDGGVIESHRGSHHVVSRESEVIGRVPGVYRHRRDVSDAESSSSAIGHWKTLSRRLNAVLRMMRSRQTGRSSGDVVTSGRTRRSFDQDDKAAREQAIIDDIDTVEHEYGPGREAAQQRTLEGQVLRAEQRAGAPSDDEKRALEEEIVREVHQAERQESPEYKRQQQQAIEQVVVDADRAAHRAVAQRKFEQHREIQRELDEFLRKAGVPSEEDRLAQERQIVHDVQAVEARERARQSAIQQKVAADIKAMLSPNSKLAGRTDTTPGGTSSSSEESRDTGDATSNAASALDDDGDRVYDDAFGDDTSLTSPLDENVGDDDILSPDRDPLLQPSSASGTGRTSSGSVASGTQGQVEGAPPNEEPVKTTHSSWQVTLMTVIMCTIVGLVLLLVVGTWYRDLSFRSFRPGKPENMLLEDDEQAVYHGTTTPEPRQVGAYAPLT